MKNIPVSFQSGVHTFEISQTLTKNQFTSVLNRAHARGKLIHNRKGQESYVLLDQQMPGITVTLYPIHQRRTYRVNIKVEPCRVLGSDDPTALYQYSKKSFHKLQQLCDRYLEMLCIPGSIEAMKVSRCDLTCNLGFPDQDYVEAYLRILKKSHIIPGYRVDTFKANAKKAKDPKRANQHSHCIRCKQVSFLCYDKIDQLKMVGRCPHELEDAATLRLEAQLKRPALKRALGKRALEDNAALLKAASDQVAEVIHSYLSRMFPCSGTHLQYEDAVSVVQKIKKETLREQMLYLLRKVSDAATWDSASRKLNEHYTDVTDKQIKKIHCKFDELGISPITLLDNRSMKSLPPLSQFFE